MTILVYVINQELRLATPFKTLIDGTQEFIKFKFLLDNAWAEITTFAQFTQNDVAYNVYLDEDNCVYLPPEINTGTFTLMLYGTGDNTIGTSNYLTIKMDDNILIENAQSTEITQSLYSQLVNSVNSVNNNLNTITTARTSDVGKYLKVKSVNNGKVSAWEFDEGGSSGGGGGSGQDGQDGYSPTITVTNITGGHRVSITDVNGTKTFNVMNGTNGTNGTNGVSPTVTVTNITNGHRVSITDVNGTKTFDVMNGSGSGGGTVTEVYYATPEDYGASGDGVTDDSSAIQQAINSGKPVNFSHKTYFIHSTITINNKDNWTMNAQDATFVYDGSAYAFQILYTINSQINIGTIKANNGGGIKFYSANKDSFNQYINLTFNYIECKTNCIYSYAESGGWCNENRIFGGRFAAGENGVSISHADGNETDGWKFYDCGIEGVTNGFMFNAGLSTQGRISAIAIINPRYAESYTTVLKTVGSVFDCLWVGTCVFKSTEIDCSTSTSRFEIVAPIGTIWDEGVYRHRGCITNGELIAEVTLYDGQTPTSIDTTLTVEGAAADAKATGDEVSLLKEDLTKISTATLSDVGKALKVKTVESGKVTEWEFSEAVTDIALSIVNGQLCMTYSE